MIPVRQARQIENAVKRISRAYEVRGMINKISSYSDPVVGFGSIDNEVTMDYNEFTQLTKESQSHSGAVSSSPNVQYAYANGGSSSNQIRPTSITYPNARVIGYDYGSATDDDRLSRVTNIKDGLTALAGYTYLGAGTVLRIDYAQPGVRLDLWGGTSGTFSGIDLFGRVIDQQWVTTGGSPTVKDRYKYGYDRNSNRQWRRNSAGSSLDEYYTYDNLNRLTEMQRGTLNSTTNPTGISGTPVAEQDWTLDPTGNWNGFIIKDNTGLQTLNQSRTQNKVNEITAIAASGGTPVWATPAYDAAGNMTSMPKPSSLTNSYTATYDAWNRMCQVKDSGTAIATYGYDGRNRRITVDTGVVRHFYFTNSWQDVEERLGSLTTSDQQYVWGIRYIDELVCRDRLVGGSSSSSSSSSGGGGLNERLYATQDANFNVTSLLDTSVNVAERYTYEPYGVRTFRNSNWSVISNSSFAWSFGHQGLCQDNETEVVFNRERLIHSSLGIFTRFDPIAHSVSETNVEHSGPRVMKAIGNAPQNLYEYEQSAPVNHVDPMGEVCSVAVRCGNVASGAGIHCGLVVTNNDGTYEVDGSGGDINSIHWVHGNGAGWGTTYKATSLADSDCDCLFKRTQSWNLLAVPRDHLNRNSNWTLRCLTSGCGITLTFTGITPPTGWDCKDCTHYTAVAMPECVVFVCDKWTPCPCP